MKSQPWQEQGEEGEPAQSRRHFSQPLVVAGQPPEPAEPGEAPLDRPPPGEEYEPLLRLDVLDDLQPDAVPRGRLARSGTLTVPPAREMTAFPNVL